MYKQKIVTSKEFDQDKRRYKGGRTPVDVKNRILLRVNIRDLAHFYKLVTFLNKNIGHAKWKINKQCKKALLGPSPPGGFNRYGIKRTIIMPADAKELVTAILLM